MAAAAVFLTLQKGLEVHKAVLFLLTVFLDGAEVYRRKVAPVIWPWVWQVGATVAHTAPRALVALPAGLLVMAVEVFHTRASRDALGFNP